MRRASAAGLWLGLLLLLTVATLAGCGDDDLVYVAVGAKDGYVANDGHLLPSVETG